MVGASSPGGTDRISVLHRLVCAYAAFQADPGICAGDPGLVELDRTVSRLFEASAESSECLARHEELLHAAEARFAQAEADGLAASEGWAALCAVRDQALQQHVELLAAVRATDSEVLRLAMLIEEALPERPPENRTEGRARERARRARLH